MWNHEVLERYKTESAVNDLINEIANKKAEFENNISGVTYRGNSYGFGGMRPEVSIRLYGLIREYQPRILVETGVCNGVSSAVILATLEKNKSGFLYSIDLPEIADTNYDEGTFWEGKKGAVIPKSCQSGWLIPDQYRARWHLTLGQTQMRLPTLLSELDEIDFFLHDSEHSYECMTFEYEEAWKYLKSGGLLVSDDINWNSAFEDFSKSHSRDINIIDSNIAFIIK